MSQQADPKPKLKVQARILVYNEGREPNVGEPDRIIEGGEHICEYDNHYQCWRDQKTGQPIPIGGIYGTD